jgi:hypothetical protein
MRNAAYAARQALLTARRDQLTSATALYRALAATRRGHDGHARAFLQSLRLLHWSRAACFADRAGLPVAGWASPIGAAARPPLPDNTPGVPHAFDAPHDRPLSP